MGERGTPLPNRHTVRAHHQGARPARSSSVPKERKVGEGGEHTPSSHAEQGTRQGRDTGSRRLWSIRGETQGTGGKEPEGTPAPERCGGRPEAQRPTCQRESAITGGQEVACEEDTEACVGRGAHVRGRTRTNTHTQSHSLAARDPDVESERPSYKLGFRTQSQRERPGHTETHAVPHRQRHGGRDKGSTSWRDALSGRPSLLVTL